MVLVNTLKVHLCGRTCALKPPNMVTIAKKKVTLYMYVCIVFVIKRKSNM